MPQLPDLSGLTRILGLVVAFLGAYLFAVWVSMIIWAVRDIRARSRDIFAQVLAVALVLVFNVAGLVLYFILRPRETLAEKYERELAEEAMLQDIEERQVCPLCHHKITAEYLICPNCHTKLHKKCDNCGRILNLKWNVCPYCGEPQAMPTAPRTWLVPAPGLSEAPPPPPLRDWKREPLPTPSKVKVPAALAAPADGKPSSPQISYGDDGKSETTNPPLVPPTAQPIAPPEAS